MVDQYATHSPVLREAVERTTGKVLEFGCGEGSTPLLHALCGDRDLVTFESDREWLDKFIEFDTGLHRFVYVPDWTIALYDAMSAGPYDVVFVDQAPWEARYRTINSLVGKTKYIVLHDCDYFPEHGMLGKNVRGIVGPDDVGDRVYDFRYWKEFFPMPPWPYPQTGPPTLLASDFFDCDWEVEGMMEGCKCAKH